MRILFTAALVLAGAVFAHSGDELQGQTDPADPAYNTDLDFAQVEYVLAAESSKDIWRFDVTVRHNDEGWDHYANLWQIVDPGNHEVIGERVLAHPHENEQPFTRSQSGISVPPELKRILIRAKCDRHGFGGREILIDLSKSEGHGYRVLRR